MGTLTFQAAAGGSVNLLGPNIAGTVNLTLPTADGTNGQPLQTNGSGTLSFANLGTAAGGTGLTSFTSGGVVYASSTSAITTGSSFVFDGTNVGIGVATPQEKLEVKTATSTQILVGAGAGFTYGIGRETVNGFLRFYGNQSGAIGYIFTGADGEWARINASGNVGIGTSSPSASAILDAQSTTKGVRMPNMTTTQKNAISSPAAGLMVFDTTLAKLCVYSGSAWQTITSI